MWATLLSIVDFFFKTQTLLATLRTQHLLLGESFVSSEAEHLSPSVGCVRNKRLYPTVLQSEIVLSDAGLRMDGLPAPDLWDIVIEVLRSTINIARQNKLTSCRQQTESLLFCGFRSQQHTFSSG